MDSIAPGIDPQKLSSFRAELNRALEHPAAFPDSLRESAWAIVDDMKASARMPEEVIIEIRRICSEAGLGDNAHAAGALNRGAHDLVDRLISSCIEHYYQ